MNEFFEECVNDVGLKFKRKKKEGFLPLKKRDSIAKSKEQITSKPILIDLKKSLEKLENLSKKSPKKKENVIKDKELEEIEEKKEKIPINYPKLTGKIKLSLDFEYYNKDLWPELRWPQLVKDISEIEYKRVKECFKKDPFFVKQCIFSLYICLLKQ